MPGCSPSGASPSGACRLERVSSPPLLHHHHRRQHCYCFLNALCLLSVHRETNAIKYVHEHEHIHALALLTQRLAAFSQTGEWRQQLCVDTHLTVINYHPNTVTGRQRREEAPRSFTASLTEPKGLFASYHSSRRMDQSLNK